MKLDTLKDRLYVGLSDGSIFSKSKIFPLKLTIKAEEWDRFPSSSLPVYNIIPLSSRDSIIVLYKRKHLPETILTLWAGINVTSSIHSLKAIDCFTIIKQNIFWISDGFIRMNTERILEPLEESFMPLYSACVENFVLFIGRHSLIVYDSISLNKIKTFELFHKINRVFSYNFENNLILLLHDSNSLDLSILLCQRDENENKEGDNIRITNQK